MRSLEFLHLSFNFFTSQRKTTSLEPFFASLTNCTSLMELGVAGNDLVGMIPPIIGRLSPSLMHLHLQFNKIFGPIPANLSYLANLSLLNLSRNLLNGSIPQGITSMRQLEQLDLSNNMLSGTIPPQLGHCVELEYLDVSRNGLTGELPLSLENVSHVNFSYNDFWGEVPSGGTFARFPANAFLGNPRLCTETMSMMAGLAKCSGGKHNMLHNRRVLPVVLTIASFTMAIIVLAACRAMGRDGRRSALLAYVGGLELSNRGGHPRISQRELSEATGGFEQSRLIGAGRFGRVYGGTLRDGTRVAVKVLDPMTRGGEVSWSFKRECDVLRWTRHRNLVRVITTCSQPDFHALVLPWMTNGSLESRLHQCDGSLGHGMDLAWLVAIASNIAEGITYLHHYAPVRIIHCDLKPGNVLLDDDMMAVVADFGIARLVKDMGDDEITGFADPCSSIAGLLQGSVGYIAPGNLLQDNRINIQ
jgi:hypothetical protein